MNASPEAFGFKLDVWEAAKCEAICVMLRAGRNGNYIFYSDLARQVTSISLEPHSFAMDRFLDEISKEEDMAGRGILTALVVLKEQGIPGSGFWATAADIGRHTRNKLACWSNEFARVLAECKKDPRCR